MRRYLFMVSLHNCIANHSSNWKMLDNRVSTFFETYKIAYFLYIDDLPQHNQSEKKASYNCQQATIFESFSLLFGGIFQNFMLLIERNAIFILNLLQILFTRFFLEHLTKIRWLSWHLIALFHFSKMNLHFLPIIYNFFYLNSA